MPGLGKILSSFCPPSICICIVCIVWALSVQGCLSCSGVRVSTAGSGWERNPLRRQGRVWAPSPLLPPPPACSPAPACCCGGGRAAQRCPSPAPPPSSCPAGPPWPGTCLSRWTGTGKMGKISGGQGLDRAAPEGEAGVGPGGTPSPCLSIKNTIKNSIIS